MEESLITFATFYNAIEANIQKTKLIDAGIPCVLQDENINGFYNGSLVSIKLQLHPENALLAMAVLELSKICPECLSPDIQHPPRPVPTKRHFFGEPDKKFYICKNCGFEFN
ncbi:MAG: hypothetical protein H7Y04_03210 [Verrucomicrobia bacterium]|nr:hypothetical protein [Cytophagales bacterium]